MPKSAHSFLHQFNADQYSPSFDRWNHKQSPKDGFPANPYPIFREDSLCPIVPYRRQHRIYALLGDTVGWNAIPLALSNTKTAAPITALSTSVGMNGTIDTNAARTPPTCHASQAIPGT